MTLISKRLSLQFRNAKNMETLHCFQIVAKRSFE
jgi:hypothetical protein